MPRIWKITWILIVFLFVMFIWIFVIGMSSNQPGSNFNKGHNAVWISHKWVGDDVPQIEIANLVSNLTKRGIDTVFVHTGPIGEDGNIDPITYQFAINFVDRAKAINPKIEYQAWLGQIRSKIDLGNGEVRKNISKLCRILPGFVGFDGIHFDIEPVWDEDSDFIKVLETCKAEIAVDKKISVAMSEFIPKSLIWLTKKTHNLQNYNTEVNYKNVAEFADQIVVMAYDTGFESEKWYEWLVSEQTIWLTSLLEDTELFVGIPAYDEQTESFDPKVENIESGLRGVIKGLNNIRSEEKNFAGVAIYPYWKIDGFEWKEYDKLWID